MTREEEIKQAAEINADNYAVNFSFIAHMAFEEGALWADENPKNPWRDASKELPEDNKTVLVWFGGYYTVAVLRDNEWWECTGYQTGGGWSALNKIPDIASRHITHWMPIPDAPEGGEK